MPELDKKTWTVLWVLPLLFIVVVLSGYAIQHTRQLGNNTDLSINNPKLNIQQEGENMALAEKYEVSGAGSSEANKTYEEQISTYFLAGNNYNLSWDGSVWSIYDDDSFELYTNSGGTSDFIPETGWQVESGSAPAPTVTAVAAPYELYEEYEIVNAEISTINTTYTRNHSNTNTPYFQSGGDDDPVLYYSAFDERWEIQSATGIGDEPPDLLYYNNTPLNDVVPSSGWIRVSNSSQSSLVVNPIIPPADFEPLSFEVNSEGNLVITWQIDNEPASGTTGMTLSGGYTLDNWQHSGDTSTAVVTPPIIQGISGLKLSYDDNTGDFTDDEDNPLEAFSDEGVVNNSELKKKYKPIVWNDETNRLRRLREDEALDIDINIAPRVRVIGTVDEVTPDASACDIIHITSLATNVEIKNPINPVDGGKLIIRIKDNGTQRNITWDTAYREVMGNTLPEDSVANETFYVGFIYNAQDGKWDLVAV